MIAAKLLWKFNLAATLPTEADLSALPYPLYASYKLDGVRAGVQRGVLVSRNGRPIANIQAQEKFGRSSYEGFDGELTFGKPNAKDVFNQTVRVTQKRDNVAGEQLAFHVFDWMYGDEREALFKTRYAQLKAAQWADIDVVRQTLIKNAEELSTYEARAVAAGYEGVMLRRADAGPYMEKRSTLREFALVKMKRFDYSTARLLRVFPLRHNDNEERVAGDRRSSKKCGIRLDKKLIGSAEVADDKTGAVFTINVPTDALRAWPGWANCEAWRGRHIRYKHQPVGALKGGAPRFPTATFEELL